jgi:hypothetical protein
LSPLVSPEYGKIAEFAGEQPLQRRAAGSDEG